jgi:CO/xanthine dehydrogenase Mo-binding subunit
VRSHTGRLVQAFLDLAAGDEQSPLQGRQRTDVTVTDGRIHPAGDPSSGETYRDILTRHGLDELAAGGAIDPQPAQSATAPAGVFAEVRVDQDLGVLRVARLASVIDGGQVLNEKTARSQVTGATVMAIGMTLLEETIFDPGTGRIANATLGDYLIPVHADVPDIDVVFVGEPDKFSPIGAKGLGEVGTVGVSAAIANAVYHATGRRIRSLPITLDKLL